MDKINEQNINNTETQRAPREREAPVPLRRGPITPKTPPESSKVSEIFGRKSSLDFDQNAGFHSGPSAKRKGYKLAMWSCLASFVDLLILISLSCVFILVFSLVMQSPVVEMFHTLQVRQHRLVLFAEVLLLASWLYMISLRGIMGASIGEWACDLRLGQPHERFNSKYILKVALRSTLVLLSGVILMPLLSVILGRDLAGKISGVRLFSLK